MAVLVPGQVFRSRAPMLPVENALEPGSYRFRLVVVDNEQNRSLPTDLVVRVVRTLQPVAPVGDATLRAIRPVSPLTTQRPTPPRAVAVAVAAAPRPAPPALSTRGVTGGVTLVRPKPPVR